MSRNILDELKMWLEHTTNKYARERIAKAIEEITRLRGANQMTDSNPYLYALTTDPGKPMREAQEQIKKLTAERDEARQFVCNREYLMTGMTTTPEQIAKERGWDCFKEDGK
jgi:hypothetical protein